MSNEIEGRAQRLEDAFPGAYSRDGALVTFNMAKIKEALGWREPIRTKAGVEFSVEKGAAVKMDDRIWISVKTKIGNILSSWSWRLSAEEWATVVTGIEEVLRDG